MEPVTTKARPWAHCEGHHSRQDHREACIEELQTCQAKQPPPLTESRQNQIVSLI